MTGEHTRSERPVVRVVREPIAPARSAWRSAEQTLALDASLDQAESDAAVAAILSRLLR